MEEFIQKHRPILASTIFMVLGLLAAGYSVFYSRLTVFKSDLGMAAHKYRLENSILKEEKKKQTKKDGKKNIGIRYLPTFLQRINEIARHNDVIIKKLSPDADETLKFKLDFISTYYTFVNFTSELEALDIILNDLQIHPYDHTQSPPQHAISFTLTPRNDAEPLADIRLSRLQQKVAEKDKRDPFQRFAFDSTRVIVSRAIDLTWIYKLGGLGLDTSGNRYATINHANYSVGDILDGRTITNITNKEVKLEKTTREGKLKYRLGFRKKKSDKNR